MAAEAESQRVEDWVNSSWAGKKTKVLPVACAVRQEQWWLWVLWVLPRFRALLCVATGGRRFGGQACLGPFGACLHWELFHPRKPARAGITQFGVNIHLTEKDIYSASYLCFFFLFLMPMLHPCCFSVSYVPNSFIGRDFYFCLNHLFGFTEKHKGSKITQLYSKGHFFACFFKLLIKIQYWHAILY